MRKGFLTFIALTGLVVATSVAQADMVTYDFTGNSFTNPLGLLQGVISTPQTITSKGLSTLLSGKSVHPDVELQRNNAGLGVRDPVVNPGANEVGVGESIEFDFSPSVVIAGSSVILEIGSQAGSLDFLVDGLVIETVTWTAGSGNSLVTHIFTAPEFDEFAPLTDLTGSVFEFVTIADAFRLVEFSVTTTQPEPGTWMLMGTGLLGLLGYGWRQRKQVS